MSTKPQDTAEQAPTASADAPAAKTKPVQKKELPASLKASPATGTSPSMLQAKKKLRAFSIQKKATITPVTVPKPVGAGSNTVLIGKLSGVKVTPKPPKTEPVDDVKKPPKPPRPGAQGTETYTELQKKNMSEIEDMKRKMELVDLGIPLGLICPTATSETGMPSKAMPPIKSFLDPAKVDELIREGKKARAEGKEFKFDLHKFLPDYDNPFQRKKDHITENDKKTSEQEPPVKAKADTRKVKRSRFESRYDYRKDDRHKDDREKYSVKHREKEKKDREKRKEEKREFKKEDTKKDRHANKFEKDVKETDVHLNEYLVCDSWSLDTDKTNSSSPKPIEKSAASVDAQKVKCKDINKKSKDSKKTKEIMPKASPVTKQPKLEKLQPVIDSFKYELDANEDEVLDIYVEEADLEKYPMPAKKDKSYDSPLKLFDYDQEPSTADDDNFLESVINEIKQEDMSDISQDKGLVEYDLSPMDDQVSIARESVTPELDERMRSQQSHYSDGYRSSESGYKSRESGYKSDRSESYRMSVDKELDEPLDTKMSRSMMDSLETWSFVLKICQPLLFRHDKNKCYKETHSLPKLWYTENPRVCNCVKDRAIVYGELETCKMTLVDRVYGCDQIADTQSPKIRNWYPREAACLTETSSMQLATEWETEECQQELPPVKQKTKDKLKSMTPQKAEETSLDMEYQRFMMAVWPEVNEGNPDTPRSTTPVRQEIKRKKKEDDKDAVEKKKTKKMKLSSEGWSQESDVEEDVEKIKKVKIDKEKRKRKLSNSTLSSTSDNEDNGVSAKKKKKTLKKKTSKKPKSKVAKRRLSKKYIMKKLKEKQKKKRKIKAELKSEDSDGSVVGKDSVKEKKARKKKEQKFKKAQKKRKAKARSSSSSSSSDSSSETDSDDRRRKKKKEAERKKRKEKKKRKKSSSSSTHSDDIFDVNILKNIKTERLSDDEKNLTDFSPRRHKHREIINVKELQNDFVGNNIHIKQEKEEEKIEHEEEKSENDKDLQMDSQADSISRSDPQTEESTVDDDSKKSEIKEPETLPHIEESSQLKNLPLPVPEPTQLIPIIPEPVPQIPKPPPHIPEAVAEIQIPIAQIPVPPSQIPVLPPQVSVPPPQASEPPPQASVPPPQASVPPPQASVPPPQASVPPPQASVPPPQASVPPPQVPVPLSQVPIPPPQVPAPPSHIPLPLPQTPIPRPQVPERTRQIQDRTPQLPDESNNSQCSSQESVCSVRDLPYEKDDSHLRPSSQNSNYSFNDVISASQGMFPKMDDIEDKFEGYEQGNYEMYEHLAMAYQSDVANQIILPAAEAEAGAGGAISRIETVVGGRRGEIKCDWRAGDRPAALHRLRPSRWGLKPGEVNIVLTDGGSDRYSNVPVCAVEPVYQIESIANRTIDNNSSMSYDEAYMDMYGASDKLQYGDCFAVPTQSEVITISPEPEKAVPESEPTPARRTSSLDARIDKVLRETPLSQVSKTGDEDEKDGREKGILVRSLSVNESGRGAKRVSFADGYKPGQDSDVEEPPVKKKKKASRRGCAWPCPATHADHVPLWDALPPPPPPAGSPPPPPAAAPPPAALLAALRRQHAPPPALLPLPHPHPHPHPHPLAHHHQKFDPNSPMPPFMPPEPPPGMINFH